MSSDSSVSISIRMSAKQPLLHGPRIRKSATAILDLLKSRDEKDSIRYKDFCQWRNSWGTLIRALQLSRFQCEDFNFSIEDVISARTEYENAILFNIWCPDYGVRDNILHRLITPLAVLSALNAVDRA